VKPSLLFNDHFRISRVVAAVCLGFFSLARLSAQPPAVTPSPETLTDSTGIRLQLIKAGTVTLGSSQQVTISAPEERPQHDIQIADDYYIGVTEVTQKQWYAVMGTRPWRTPWNTLRLYVTEGDNYPATWITWPEAQAFCERLSGIQSAAYRLPTEAEWELACRAGSATLWSFGDDAGMAAEHGWFRENTVTDMFSLRPREVGGKTPGSTGLLDMHGNVAEWCQDSFQTYPLQDTAAQPTSLGVLRGGTWFVTHNQGRAATRDRLRIRRRLGSSGLRVVRELPGKAVPETPPTPPVPPPVAAPIPAPVPAPGPVSPAVTTPSAVSSPDVPSAPAAPAIPAANRSENSGVVPGCCASDSAPDALHCVPAGAYLRGPRCRIPLIPVLW